MPTHHRHPGELLAHKLEEFSMSSAALARHMRVPANRVSQIISGKRSITADTALRLGKCFNTDPDYWLSLQIQYELEQEVRQAEPEIAAIAPLSSLETAQRFP